jgi:hypothetical protein
MPGTRRRPMLTSDRLIGNQATKVLTESTMPVLIFR